MRDLERELIKMMRAGQQRSEPLHKMTRDILAREHPDLSERTTYSGRQILNSRDQVMALEGVAGAGKTTSLQRSERMPTQAGYDVEGFAPTSRAAQQLADAGIPSMHACSGT